MIDTHALSRISYVDQNAAAPPLPQQPPPTSWGHDLTDIEKFCWENFEKWPRIRLFYQIFKNLRKKKFFLVKILFKDLEMPQNILCNKIYARV